MENRFIEKTMRTIVLPILALFSALPAAAQDAAMSVSMPQQVPGPGMDTMYILLGMAILQAIIILTLSGIMKTMGGTGTVWVDYLRRGKAGIVAIPLLLFAGDAQAAVPGTVAMVTTQNLFWWLVAVNVLFFIIIAVQLVIIRGLVRTLAGTAEQEAGVQAGKEEAWVDSVLQSLTKRAAPEKEKDILLHHEYDGIRELDNVLPPWWLWLFYGTIAWGVIYIANVHIFGIWDDQETEYVKEMAQAEADVKAYLAKFSDMVDENSVTALTDAAALAQGKSIFQQFCRACHGEVGEGNAVGPNLTDAYWMHGGSINDVFRTIKYGVPEKGMQSWKTDLKPTELQAVSSYILSLQGSNPPNAKEPQGELWLPKEEPEGGEEAAPAAPADTVSVAVLP